MPPRDDEDARAFAAAMADARKLGGRGRIPVTRTPAPGAAPRRSGVVAHPAVPVESAARLMVEEVGEQWTARADGIDRRFTRKLAAGKVAIEARLDLHGHSRSESERVLERFLDSARANGQRCLLVIDGRGLHSGTDGPALREAVRTALLEGVHAAHVLACVTAPPPLGGGGATLIWLRR